MAPRSIALLVLVFALPLCPDIARAEPPRPDVFDVESFMEGNPEAGLRVRIRGVVGEIRPDRKLLSLVDLSDRDELLESGKTECVTLPVRWAGAMPALHQAVLAEGHVQEEAGKLVFVASSLAPLPVEAPQ